MRQSNGSGDIIISIKKLWVLLLLLYDTGKILLLCLWICIFVHLYGRAANFNTTDDSKAQESRHHKCCVKYIHPPTNRRKISLRPQTMASGASPNFYQKSSVMWCYRTIAISQNAKYSAEWKFSIFAISDTAKFAV